MVRPGAAWRPWVGAVGAAGLLVSLHLPWYRVDRPAALGPAEVSGVEALTNVAIAVGLAGVAALVCALLPGRRAAALQLGLGGVAAALALWRILSLPAVPPAASVADGALFTRADAVRWGALVAVGCALVVVATAALDLRAGRRAPLPRIAQVGALRDAWGIAWRTSLLVLVAGVLGALTFPAGIPTEPWQRPFGPLGDLLVTPFTNWDASAYLAIADFGYAWESLTAFFPLYPLAVFAAGWVIDSFVLGGIIVSLAALTVALHLLGRLVALEVGERYASPAMLVTALFPMAVFFSAVYTESLFLALSVGSVYAARRSAWAWAGVLGGLAAATRSVGVLLVVPLVIMWLEARRQGRPDGSPAWIALVPLGLCAYLAYMATWGSGDPFQPFQATREHWDRQPVPLGVVWEGVVAAFDSVRQLEAGPGRAIVETRPGVEVTLAAARNLTDFAFMAYALIALAGAVRRLPAAWWAYAAVGLAAVLSAPSEDQPMQSLPRYLMVIFPLQVWVAVWAVDRGRLQEVLIVSGALLGLFTAEFAAYRFVA